MAPSILSPNSLAEHSPCAVQFRREWINPLISYTKTIKDATYKATTTCSPRDRIYSVSHAIRDLPESAKEEERPAYLPILIISVPSFMLFSILVLYLFAFMRHRRSRWRARRWAMHRERMARQQVRVRQIQDNWHNGRAPPPPPPSTWIKWNLSQVVSWGSTTTASTASSPNQPQPQSNDPPLSSSSPPSYVLPTGALPSYEDDEAARPQTPPPTYAPATQRSRVSVGESFAYDFSDDRLALMSAFELEAWGIQPLRQPLRFSGASSSTSSLRVVPTETDENEWVL